MSKVKREYGERVDWKQGGRSELEVYITFSKLQFHRGSIPSLVVYLSQKAVPDSRAKHRLQCDT